MELAMEPEIKNSIEIKIPVMVQTRINFEFNASSPYGRYEELVVLIESEYFNLPASERGNAAGYPANDRESTPINIPVNTSKRNQKITFSGTNKIYPGARTWNNSDVKLLQDNPFEKVIGFNSIAQPNNYETIKCTIIFYL